MFHNVTVPVEAEVFPAWPEPLYGVGALGAPRRRKKRGVLKKLKRVVRRLAPVALLTPGVPALVAAKRILKRKKRRRRPGEPAPTPEIVSPEAVELPEPAAALPAPVTPPLMVPGAPEATAIIPAGAPLPTPYGPAPAAPPLPFAAPEAEFELAPSGEPPSVLPTWEEVPGPAIVPGLVIEAERPRFLEPVRGAPVEFEEELEEVPEESIPEAEELGQVFWWQPTPPRYPTLGQGGVERFIERRIVRPAGKIVRALAPVAGVQVVRPAPAAVPPGAYPVTEAGVPGWVWAAGLGALGIGAFVFLMPARRAPARVPRRRRR